MHDGQIFFCDFAILPDAAQFACGFAVFGDDHDAAGFAVETIDQVLFGFSSKIKPDSADET